MDNNQLKSKVLCFVAMLVLAIVSFGNANAQFTIGIKVAGNASNYMQLTNLKFGMEGGVFMRLGDRFFFQPEVNYSFKRSSVNDQSSEYSSNSILKQHFIAVPILLGYHFINKENFKFRLTLGPRFDFKVRDNVEGSDWHSNVVQWGGQIGVGIDVWRFAFDFNYCIAADNFRNNKQGTSQTNQMNVFILSLGFKFIK